MKKFVDDPVNEGMVRKCLIGYIRNQLSEFYNLIAHIDSQVSFFFVDFRARIAPAITTFGSFAVEAAVEPGIPESESA